MKVSATNIKLLKHLRVYLTLFKASIGTVMTYRLDLVTEIFGGIIEIASYWVFIEIIFSQFDNIAGWGRYEVIAIFGVFTFTISILKSIVLDNLRDISSKIVYGDLDQYLAKPISPLFLISLENFRLFYIPRCFIGLIFTYYGLSNIQFAFDPVFLFYFIYIILLLLIIYYSLLLAVFSLSFWLGNINHSYWIFISTSEISKIPVSAFKGAWKILFVFVIPFVLFGAVPVGIMLGRISANILISMSIVALTWYLVGKLIWKAGLRSYTSGGG
ncbi:MAG: ABC-2 family transporter protein [Candidatus Dojkabacteria bacterium]|jgi:ABC-2 type transport system permease protein|nr:ABC-2 family transporter protein [Candidatus Dojkabacteria bacterium]